MSRRPHQHQFNPRRRRLEDEDTYDAWFGDLSTAREDRGKARFLTLVVVLVVLATATTGYWIWPA